MSPAPGPPDDGCRDPCGDADIVMDMRIDGLMNEIGSKKSKGMVGLISFLACCGCSREP